MEQLRLFCLLGVWLVYTHMISVAILFVAVVAVAGLFPEAVISVDGDWGHQG
jgi:hypothetical protein